MAILVTGGAGYIGSATVALLQAQKKTVVVLDNLLRGHRAAVAADVPFYHGEVGDSGLVARLCREHQVTDCIHFAALAYVGESVTEPQRYYENNVVQGVGFLRALLEAGVRRFVFSSTCATYGEPQYVPIDELHPQAPTNPYGWTKLMLEQVLRDYDAAYGLRFVALRYFNACGALPNCGEAHSPETHLIPNILRAATGQLPHVSVFGNDYPTPDGTAIRDYIHIGDLGDAHIRALDYLQAGGASEFINLGTGTGFSVAEVIAAARRVTGATIPVRMEPRRPGDPSRLVANATKAQQMLGWQPQYTDLTTIIQHAWDWQCSHPHGYESASAN